MDIKSLRRKVFEFAKQIPLVIFSDESTECRGVVLVKPLFIDCVCIWRKVPSAVRRVRDFQRMQVNFETPLRMICLRKGKAKKELNPIVDDLMRFLPI